MIKGYRQGDVVMFPVRELPKGLRRKDNVVALGEASGHSHRFEDNNVETYVNNGNNQYCVLNREATLVHDEHEPITIPEGVYAVNIQREVDLVDGVRQVMD